MKKNFADNRELMEIKEEDLIRSEDGKCYLDLDKTSSRIPASVIFERNKEEIQAIIDCISDGIFITDGEGYTLMYNKTSQEHLGEGAPNIIGKNVREIVEEGYWSESLSLQVIESRKAVSKIQIVNDQELLSTSIPYFQDGKITKIITTDRNIADLAEMSRQLQKTAKTLEKYESGLEYYIRQNTNKDPIVCKSSQMRELIEYAIKAAKQDVTVLIQGESGVGKEVFANLIFWNSTRRNGPFIKINCATIPENLIESELFGYEKGSFTGAEQKGKPGIFEIADKGTILLDEIGELPMHVQSKLLRVLQEKEFMRIGGRNPIPLDVRVIAATNIKLKKAVAEGKFREDLYYRLNIIPIEIPPLRKREDDIPEMVNKFLQEFNKKYRQSKEIEKEALLVFADYDWPGNVRELKNVMERLIITTEGDLITKSQVSSQIYSDRRVEDILAEKGKTLQEQLEAFEKRLLERTYKQAGSGSETARILGVNKSTISKKLKKYGL